MSTNNDDNDDDYLDDPISLLAIEDIKIEFHDDKDQIIDVSSDEEEDCTSAYGKKNFILPVTFFDISRNVRLLNKCKPLSIRIVDCKQYTKYQDNCRNKSVETCVEAENTCKSVNETNVNNHNAEVFINGIKEKVNKKQKGERKSRLHHSDSFYEKLKKRKEERKQIALKSKDLSQVDFKRNTGLVGLKITDTIFKQIVDSDKACIITKCDSDENKPNNQNNSEKTLNTSKTLAPDYKCKENCDSLVKHKSNKSKSINVVQKCKGDNTGYLSEIENTKLLKSKLNISNDKFKKKNTRTVEKLLIKKINSTENDYYVNNESRNDKTNVKSKKKYIDKNIYKEKKLIPAVAENGSVQKNVKSIDTKTKDKMTRDAQTVTIEKDCNPDIEAIEKKSKKQELESNKFLKNVGATLDYLGTSLTDTRIDHSLSRNVGVQDNHEIHSIKGHISQTDFKDELNGNKEGDQIRRSLKILSNNVIDKGRKLNKVNSDSNAARILLQPDQKESQVDPIDINFKQTKHHIECLSLTSGKDKIKIKSTISKEVSHCNETNIVEKAIVKDANRELAGPISPVIPCTTITVRTATPKLPHKLLVTKVSDDKQDCATLSATAQTQKQTSASQIKGVASKSICTNAQKESNFPNTNQADCSNSLKCADTSKHNAPAEPNTNINKTCDKKGTLLCRNKTISYINTLKINEFRNPKSLTLNNHRGIQDNVSAINKRSLSGQAVSKIDSTKGAILLNTATKPATSDADQQINGLVNNQANPSQLPNMPPKTQIPSKFSGHNAIIFRRAHVLPFGQLRNYAPPVQTNQTMVNNLFQHQLVPPGPRPMRFNHPSTYPPPPPPPNNHPSSTQVKPPRFASPHKMPTTYLRGVGTGLNHWRFYNPPLPSIYQSRSSAIMPPHSQANKKSFIGNTAVGDPIKKKFIPVAPNTVDDKQKMLAELNKATALLNNQNDSSSIHLKRKTDTVPTDQVPPKYSKPGPLSKKINITQDSDTALIPEKLSPKVGYSPPILPIFTYQESFKIFSPTDVKIATPTKDSPSRTPLKRTTPTGSIRKFDKDHKIPHNGRANKDKTKKITFEDYRKRVTKDNVDRVDVDIKRKHNESKNIPVDYNHDQGYDSDSTVKL